MLYRDGSYNVVRADMVSVQVCKATKSSIANELKKT